MIYDLIDENDPFLKQKVPPFDFENSLIDPIELAHNLTQTLLASKNGIALSANQCGLLYRVMVIKAEQMLVLFNPKIVYYSEKQVYMDEGCLSFPGLFIKIKRPEEIRMRYTLPNGVTETKTFKGMTARIIQHEYDHLEGITFVQRANRIHLERSRKERRKWKNIEKQSSSELMS